MKKLEKGSSAISFTGTDLEGNTIDLKNYSGKKVLLTFFRKASCPFCNMGIQALIKNQKEFEQKGIQVIAFFASPREEVLKYAGKQNPPFPIVSDPDFKIYEKHGIDISYGTMLKTMANPTKVFKSMTGGFFSMRSMVEDPVVPADFLINENQTVHRAHYGKNFDDHLSVIEILEWK